MTQEQIGFEVGNHCMKCGGSWRAMGNVCWCTDGLRHEYPKHFRKKYKDKKFLYSYEYFVSKEKSCLLLDTKEHDSPIYYMFDLSDENNKKALIKAGWTPPKTK